MFKVKKDLVNSEMIGAVQLSQRNEVIKLRHAEGASLEFTIWNGNVKSRTRAQKRYLEILDALNFNTSKRATTRCMVREIRYHMLEVKDELFLSKCDLVIEELNEYLA